MKLPADPWSRGRDMLERSAYRVEERRDSAGTFDFIDATTANVLAVACPVVAEPPKRGPLGRIRDYLLQFRVFFVVYALVTLPINVAGFLLGSRRFLPSKESRPRLVVRRADNEVVFTLRQSSGFLYDSRRVYDSHGSLIAQFRSHSKTTVRGGFGIIDLRGMPDDWSDTSARPWLGIVEPAGGAFRVKLVSNLDAGRILLHEVSADNAPQSPVRTSRGDCTVEASADLPDDS